MKKALCITLLLSVIIFSATAQYDHNCYYKWQNKFEKRGTTPILNGEHKGVVISIREGETSSCYLGKCVVVNQVITNMFLELDDGTYEAFNPESRYNLLATITNGTSRTIPTINNQKVNVLFINHLKAKTEEAIELDNFD